MTERRCRQGSRCFGAIAAAVFCRCIFDTRNYEWKCKAFSFSRSLARTENHSPCKGFANSKHEFPQILVQGRMRSESRQSECLIVAGLLFLLARPLIHEECTRIRCRAKKKGAKGDDAEESKDSAVKQDVDTEAVLKEFLDKMDKSVDSLQQNLVTIRAGKASPALVEGIMVSAYDTMVKLIEVGTVTAIDSTTLNVNVFDATLAGNVAKALMTANLGYTVQEDGASVKVGIPPLTKDKRAQFVKLAKDHAEKSKVAIRNVRQAAMKKIKSFGKQISEDIVKSMEKEVEDATKKRIAELDNMLKVKEDQLMNA